MAKKIFAFLAIMAAMAPAYAHVKWFSKLAVCGGTPLQPRHVFSGASFIGLYFFSVTVMVLVFFIDAKIRTSSAVACRYLLSLPVLPSDWCAKILRFGVAVTFAVVPLYFWDSPIILTPELRATGTWIIFLQLTIALLALFRATAWPAALGIVVLFAYAISLYGLVHLLDYMFFLGIAIHLVISARERNEHWPLGLGLLRLTTGASFLWVSVEKWAYPSWTYELLQFQLKPVLMGFQPEFVIAAAGFVEFSLAFTLIVGRLSSRIASGVLLALLVLATPLVGPVDAIGHFPLAIALALLAGTKNTIPLMCDENSESIGVPRPALFSVALPRSAVYCASVPAFTVVYYLANSQ